MIDAIAAYPVPLLANFAPVPQVDLPLSMVSVVDQSRFDVALRPGVEVPPVATGAHLLALDPAALDPAALDSVKLPPASKSGFAPIRTPGDRILAGIEGLRANYEQVSSQTMAVARQGDLAPQALLALQMEVAQMTLGTQLVTQVASKLEQNLNTLLKGS